MGAIGERAQRGVQYFDLLEVLTERLRQTVEAYGPSGAPQAAGRVAEELHAASLNRNALWQGAAVRARTTASTGDATSAADVVVEGSARVEVQLKYYASPGGSAYALSSGKYRSMQKVVPADTLKAVREAAARRATNGRSPRDYEDTAARVSDRIELDGVQSDPLGTDDARRVVDDPEAVTAELWDGACVDVLLKGASAGAGVRATISATTEIPSLWRRESTLGESAKRVAKEAGSGAVEGFFRSGATILARESLKRVGLASVARTSVPVALGAFVIGALDDVGAYARGEIDSAELRAGVKEAAAEAIGIGLGLELARRLCGNRVGACFVLAAVGAFLLRMLVAPPQATPTSVSPVTA